MRKSHKKYQYYPSIKNKLIYHEKIISVIFMLYGEKLKYLREEKELHQKDLAELIEVHPATYSQFEREDVIMPIKRLNTYSNFFNVSLDYLFSFTNNKQYKNVKKEINPTLSGTRLKEFRKEHKITQVNLAKFLNTTQSNIVGYEKGNFIIATPYLFMICKKYSISADYLLGKIETPKYLNES